VPCTSCCATWTGLRRPGALNVAVSGPQTVTMQLSGLAADVTEAIWPRTRLDYLVACVGGQRSGRRSVFAALPQLELQVLGSDRLPVEGQTHLWMAARNTASGQPLVGAAVKVEFELEDGTRLELAPR